MDICCMGGGNYICLPVKVTACRFHGHGEYLCFACQGMPAADVEAEAKLKACSSTTVAAARDSINKKAGCDQWSELTPRAQLTICEVIASASDTPSRKKNRKRNKNKKSSGPAQLSRSPERAAIVVKRSEDDDAIAPDAKQPSGASPTKASRVGKLAGMFGGGEGKFNEGGLFNVQCGACGALLCNGNDLRRMGR
jgi:hypothetical protein